eukprot:CAMPEP_0116142214 /NCGR_PEP_ID=MMETSP0329-20121206/14788_1 /TAXON_ID=697910 /ORGANISM="Pseudo-nitzschia arenysensis, Strain B593" /LENGTH=687 /DNA_ID=CAMNT_0003637433 /DNA_START=264 /DNA_END=2327 /DNA_ORIENTATION=+
MTATTELPQDDSFMQSLGPPSSNDLFDGDILGDELMDIYNAAVVGGGDGDDEVMNEIPSLLGPSDLSSEKKDGTLDDGFGAFRPSTSFNNLSMMLQEPNAEPSSVDVEPTVRPPNETTRVVSSTSLSPGLMISPTPAATGAPFVTTPGGTKRKATTTSGPSPKRKSAGGSAKSKQQKATSKAPANKKSSKKKNDTLTQAKKGHATTTISAGRMTAHSKVKKEPVATISPTTVVASARVPIKQESSVTSTASKMKAPQATTSSAPAAPTSVLSNPPTEADFKSVAQAAVNNLIMNAGAATKSVKTKGRSNSMPASPSSSSNKTSSITVKRVDTSTEHVKALTGSNWVAVCGGIGTTGDSNNNQSNSEKMCNRARRSNLTPDERARQNRDRNREHARNTRLRKKAYVEELKATLSALVSQRDAAELEKRHASQRELEQREVRFRVLEEFLKLRGRNEANAVRWAAILEEKFTLALPILNFREMVHSNDSTHRNANALHDQVLTGVAEVMNDSNLCSAFLQSLGKQGNSEIITFAYNCDRHNFFMDNCVAMLDWTATTRGASEQGIELIVKGHTRAKFCPASNKLISVVMSFDTGAILSQVDLINKVKASSEAEAAAAAAQVAANEADALLDSLQMPHFEAPSSTGALSDKINVVPPLSVSSNEEKAVISSDDDNHNNSKDEAEDETMAF